MRNQLLTAFDRLEYATIQSSDNSEMFKVADFIMDGHPVIVNFERVDAKTCNFMLSFLSGVVYARKGEVITITERLYMFGSEEDFVDGSLKQYAGDIR